MQKWSPEPFAVEPTVVLPAEEFRPDRPSGQGGLMPEAAATRFRKESGFSTPEALMSHLTREERATVFELVEIDVAAEYEKKEAALKENFAAELERTREEFRNWAGSFSAEMDQELKRIARACVDLSLQIAGRIVRERVVLDEGILVRAIENALVRIQESGSLTVTVNPADAARLEADPGLRERLCIGVIQKDRRIEAGGCMVQAAGREWDATLSGQMDALGELIRELADAPTGPVAADGPLPDGPGSAQSAQPSAVGDLPIDMNPSADGAAGEDPVE